MQPVPVTAKTLPACSWPASACVAQALAGAGNVDDVEVGAAEHRAGHLLEGHLDGALQRAVGREAGEAPAVPARVPDMAFRIDGGAVGDARRAAGAGEDALVRERAGGGVEVVGPDHVLVEVGVVHGAAVPG